MYLRKIVPKILTKKTVEIDKLTDNVSGKKK